MKPVAIRVEVTVQYPDGSKTPLGCFVNSFESGGFLEDIQVIDSVNPNSDGSVYESVSISWTERKA